MKAKHTLTLFLFCTLVSTTKAQRYFEFTFGFHPDSENFIVKTSDPVVIAEALAELALPDADKYLMILGPIDYGNDGYNHSWNWHFKPDQWILTPGNYEVCDGISSFIDQEPGFWIDTLGHFCPWDARLSQEVTPTSIAGASLFQTRVKTIPNPFTDHTTISWSNVLNQEHQLMLTNAVGQTVINISNIMGNQVTLHKNDLPPGIYTFTLLNQQGLLHSGKLVVQ